MTSEQDKELAEMMRKAQEGDEMTYHLLLSKLSVLLKDYFQRRQPAADTPDDFIQETLISIHKARHTYDQNRSFGPWMYAIANYRLMDWLRTTMRRAGKEVFENLPMDSYSLPEFGPGEENIADIEECLATLPDKQRRVIVLLKMNGSSVKEAALETGMSESAVKVNAHRGYLTLKKKILESRGRNK